MMVAAVLDGTPRAQREPMSLDNDEFELVKEVEMSNSH